MTGSFFLFLAFFAVVTDAFNRNEEHRNHEDSQRRRRQHAEDDCRAHFTARNAARAGGKRQR